MRHLVLAAVGAIVALTSCDRLAASETAVADEPAAPSPVAETITNPRPGAKAPAATVPDSAVVPAAPAVAAAPAPDCAGLAAHIHAVVSATGSARAKQLLTAPAQIERACSSKRNDPELMGCFLGATDSAGLDACHRKPFGGQIDATPSRSFQALEDNSGATPPVLTQDGDYLAYDKTCGMLYKEVAPAGAFFIACKGKVHIGPLVNIDEIDRVTRKIAADEQRRHEIVMNMVAMLPSADFRVPVHVYNANGSYKGVEYR